MFKVKVTVVKVDDLQSDPLALIKLNINDNLSKIRIELEKNTIVNMDNTLTFGRTNNPKSDGFSRIPRENEENSLLNEIIETDQKHNFLYLIKDSKPSWRSLNNLHNLDYGCIMVNDEIVRVNKRAFTMDGCESNLIDDFREGEVGCNSEKDRLMKKKLFFNDSELVKLGLSMEKSKQEESNDGINLYYKFTEHRKSSLKFKDYLKPTDEFIKEVEAVIKSKDPQEFKQITEKFGQFIPTEIILGGRVYFESYSKSTSLKADPKVLEAEEKSNDFSYNRKKMIGGVQRSGSFKNFDYEAWVKSLDDYKTWGCIEYRSIISIFTLLPTYLRKQIFQLVGKKILYSETKDHNYSLRVKGAREIVKLTSIFSDIAEILQNDADYNIFTTVMDSEESKYKNDYFTCQIYHPRNGNPNLIIHCIQQKFRLRSCKLKIRIMIIGYDTDLILNFNARQQLKILEQEFDASKKQQPMIKTKFKYDSSHEKFPPCIGIPVLHELSNFSLIIGHHFFDAQEENTIGACIFSYCLKNKRYVNLPSFTFYTLIISEYPNPSAFGTIPFERPLPFSKPLVNFEENSTKPKYISLLFMDENNFRPIFLKQKINQIKIKYPNCKESNCDICKNNPLKISSHESIQCSFFDPE